MPGQTGPKLTEIQRTQVKAVIAKLDGRGWSQHDIRNHLEVHHGIKISQPMVCSYRKQVYEEAQRDYQQHKAFAVAVKLEQLKDIRREAWAAWERSSEDACKVVEEFGTESEQVAPDDYVTSERMLKRIETREGRLPDNAYLQTVLSTLRQERELLGLDPTEPAAQTNVNVVVAGGDFWRGLAEQVAGSSPRAVEQRINQVVEATEVLDGTSDT